jgi:CubicO group peptidase (beta-lactamase class C family)
VLPRAATPESVGLSSAQLDRLAAVTREHVASGVVPGALIVIARHGRIAYAESFGARDRAANKAMAEDAIFRLYSMTKPIVSVAVMMLVEEGRLQVDDPVSRYLPEIGSMKVGVERKDASGASTVEMVAPSRPMTVQDLLRHTSGLTYGGRARGPVADLVRAARLGSRNESNQEFVDKLSRTPLMFSPGARWEYGVSTDVLGRLVEVISGKPLGVFLEERIFRPLGMVDTAFWIPPAKLARAAQPWQRPGGPPMTPRFDVAVQPRFESGGGGLTGTAADYLRFTTMLLNGGELNGQRLLGKKSVQFMTADHTGALALRRGDWAGFQVRRQAGVAGCGLGSELRLGGQCRHAVLDRPAEQLIAMYMVQVNTPIVSPCAISSARWCSRPSSARPRRWARRSHRPPRLPGATRQPAATRPLRSPARNAPDGAAGAAVQCADLRTGRTQAVHLALDRRPVASAKRAGDFVQFAAGVVFKQLPDLLGESGLGAVRHLRQARQYRRVERDRHAFWNGHGRRQRAGGRGRRRGRRGGGLRHRFNPGDRSAAARAGPVTGLGR